MEKTLNIAFIGYFFDPGGGIQRTFLTLAEHLGKRNFSFHMINLAQDDFQDRFRACGQCRYISDPQQVIEYLRRNRIDIVHTNNCDAGSYLAHIAGVPRIIERLSGWGSAFIFDKTPVDAIVCSTDRVYQKTLLTYPHKFVTRIYNGVDTSVFHPTATDMGLKSKLGISPHDVVIGYLGRISREKRQDTFLDIFARINRIRKNTKLILAGNAHDNDYRKIVEQKIARLNLNDSVFLLDGTEHPERIINAFHIAVLYSGTYKKPDGSVHVHQEGLSNAVVENMAMGKPMVVTDSGETRTLIQDNINGFVVRIDRMDDFYEKLLYLIKNKSLWQIMGDRSRKIVEQTFNIQRMIDQYEKMYRYVLSDDFRKKYPQTRKNIPSYFFKTRLSSDNHEKNARNILVMRSGSQRLTDYILKYIHKNFTNPKISFLCNKHNYEQIRKYHGKVFVNDSHTFNLNAMRALIDEINLHGVDYLFFIFNEFNGIDTSNADNFYISLKYLRQSRNIIDIANAINATEKVAVTSQPDMFSWHDSIAGAYLNK